MTSTPNTSWPTGPTLTTDPAAGANNAAMPNQEPGLLVILRKQRELFPFGPIINNKLDWKPSLQEEQIFDQTLDRNFKFRQYTGLPAAAAIFLGISETRRRWLPSPALDAIGKPFMASKHAFALVVGSVFAAGQVGRAISVWQGYQDMRKLGENESEFVRRCRGADRWGVWQFNLGVMFAKKVEKEEPVKAVTVE